MLQHVDRILLRIPQLEAALRFYRDVLGLKVLRQDAVRRDAQRVIGKLTGCHLYREHIFRRACALPLLQVQLYAPYIIWQPMGESVPGSYLSVERLSEFQILASRPSGWGAGIHEVPDLVSSVLGLA